MLRYKAETKKDAVIYPADELGTLETLGNPPE